MLSLKLMNKIQIPKIYLKAIIYLLLIAGFWLAFAPKQIGGKYIYIIVSGNSMEPYLRNGDLAVIHPSKKYQVGEVVLYRNPDLGSVIHRIISIDSNRYTIQGDHNEWVDSYSPIRSEIYGKLWFHIPSAGKAIEKVRTPIGAALLAGIIGVFIFWPDREKLKS